MELVLWNWLRFSILTLATVPSVDITTVSGAEADRLKSIRQFHGCGDDQGTLLV
jgi:hypothetical protein